MILDEEQVICDVCGSGEARIRRATRAYGEGADLLVIENVPIISCPDRGESHVTARTLREIESIKRNRRRVAVERPVEVAMFA